MTIKLKRGYSRSTIAENIASLARDGLPRNSAIRIAFNAARASFFSRHPRGHLPDELAYPPGKHRMSDYLANGAPNITARHNNPVGELDIDDDEMAEIQHGVAKQMHGKGAQARQAAALYSEFTGHKDIDLTKVSIPPLPKAACVIGYCDGILYSTVRDGIPERYKHDFKKSARPLLAVSPDGRQLILLGGAFNFTDRGIVDE